MDPLYLIRIPGDAGPIVRLSGPLTVSTLQHLERELSRLAVLRHPVLTVNLSGCTRLDQSGMLALLELAVRLEREGRHLQLVADGSVARELAEWEIAEVIPVFPTESAAETVARPDARKPRSWSDARPEGREPALIKAAAMEKSQKSGREVYHCLPTWPGSHP